MKKFIKIGVFVFFAVCLAMQVSAVLGRINVASYISCDGRFVEASGNTTEVIASPEDTMNIYAKTAIADPNDTILASGEKTLHYTSKVYASCSTNAANPILGKYYAATLGAVRYVDDVKLETVAYSRKIELVQLVNIDAVKEFQTSIINQALTLGNAGYRRIPLDELAQGTATNSNSGTKSSDNKIPVLTEIYASHFYKVNVGDKMPQLYLSNDGTNCFVLDENINGTVTKTVYFLKNNRFEYNETIVLK